MKKILYDLFYEDGILSLTRVLSCLGYSLFAIGSLYLMVNQIEWGGYDIFAAYTGGGGAVLQFGNKFINSKYNSIPGSYKQNNSTTTYTSINSTSTINSSSSSIKK